MKNKIKIIILTMIIIFWMAFIFSMSAKDAVQSANISGGLTYNVLNLMFSEFRGLDKHIKDTIVEGLQFVVRKGAHFSAYAILGGLCFIDIGFIKKITFKKRFWSAFLVAALYAVFDEIHQYFVPGRSCEIRDMTIDSMGVLFGISIVIIFNLLIKKLKYNKNMEI